MKPGVTVVLRVVGLLASFSALACSSDSDGVEPSSAGTGGSGGGTGGANPNGGAGAAPSGGTPSGGAGGAPNGGAGASGGSGAAGGGTGGAAGSVSGMHCSPGTAYENFRAYVEGGGPISNCQGYDPTLVDIPASEDIYVRSIALTPPLGASETMAFSIEWNAGSASLEFWGTNGVCGDGTELVGTGESRAPNITCVTLSGAMSHPHVLMVWRNGGGQHGDVTICRMGSCSP